MTERHLSFETPVDRVLVISPNGEMIKEWLMQLGKSFSFRISIEDNSIHGLYAAKKQMPMLAIIDDELPDMNGMCLATILHDMVEGKDTTIYVINVKQLLPNTKADYFLPKMEKDDLKVFLMTQLRTFFTNRNYSRIYSDDIAGKRTDQLANLPRILRGRDFLIQSVFSPYDQLSGDGFNYYLADDGMVYGYLYDCTGHGPMAYPYVAGIRKILDKSCMLLERGFYDNLSQEMADVNRDVFNTAMDGDPATPAVLLFRLDFERDSFQLCSAGIPAFYLKRLDKDIFEKHTVRNFLLGIEEDAFFNEEQFRISDLDEIMLATDGWLEIYNHRNHLPKPSAKHDDVSMVRIQLHTAGESKQ